MFVTVETVMTLDAYYSKNHFEQLWGRFHTRRLFSGWVGRKKITLILI